VSLVDARRTGAEDEPCQAEDGHEADRDDEVVRHGMDPAGRVGEILTHPEKKNRSDHRKLAGYDKEGVSPLAPLVEQLDLVGGEVALFRGKKVIGHQSLSPGQAAPAADRGLAHCFDSIT